MPVDVGEALLHDAVQRGAYVLRQLKFARRYIERDANATAFRKAGRIPAESGDEAENFQAVGVRLRECLISFINETADDDIVPEGESA